MTHLPAATSVTGATSLGDRGASILRTAIPAVWGAVVIQLLAWLAPSLPGDVGDSLATLLESEVALGFVTAVAIAIWYALWRVVEPHLPDWLTRLVLGSAAAPTYAKTTPDGAAVVTTLDGQIRVGDLPATPAGVPTYDSADEFAVPGDDQPRA
jgi:hypothetical protein